MYANQITPYFKDCVNMKCPFIFIFTELNVGILAATTFRISRIYSYAKHAQCWEWEPILLEFFFSFSARGKTLAAPGTDGFEINFSFYLFVSLCILFGLVSHPGFKSFITLRKIYTWY